MTEGDSSTATAMPEENRSSLPWASLPKFVPGTTDVTEYSRKMQFLAQMWPVEHLPSLAPRAALLCEGTAFKKLARLSPEKLKTSDTSGVELLVRTLGGDWGQTVLEEKYEHFERAIYQTVQRSDETHDSYLARHDVHFEELLAQSINFEELRSYVLLRQSQLSSEDKKKIVVEHGGQLTYDRVRSSIRLLGSKFFHELQGQRQAGNRTKTYDALTVDHGEPEEASSFVASGAGSSLGEEWEADLDSEFLEVMAAQEDADAVLVASFEGDFEDFCQEVPELQSALLSYLDARARLKEKQRARGFWPVPSNAKGKGTKGRFGSKGSFKGRKGKDREALLQRIAKSHCRLCGERGHWRAECPRNPAVQQASKEAPVSFAQTSFDPADEILESLPSEATALCASEPAGLPEDSFHFEDQMCCNVVVPVDKTVRLSQVKQETRQGISLGLKKLASSFGVPVKTPPWQHQTNWPKQRSMWKPMKNSPDPARKTRVETTSSSPQSPSRTTDVTVAIPERADDQACTASAPERVDAILDTGASRCVALSSSGSATMQP